MGLERLLDLLGENDRRNADQLPHVYLVLAGEKAGEAGFQLAEQLRDALPGLRLTMHCSGGSIKSQFRQADKSGAEIALILGDEEVQKETVGLKLLRREGEQTELDRDRLAECLEHELGM